MDIFSITAQGIIDRILQNVREIVIGLLIALGIMGGIASYRYYRYSTEVSAQKALVEALRYFNANVGDKPSDVPDAISFTTEGEKWEKVVSFLQSAVIQHASAGIVPLFLVYLAEGFWQQGKKDEAIATIIKALSSMPSPELKSLYELKCVLMQLDHEKEAMHQEGISRLKVLASNDKSVAHEMALYELGNYYWCIKNFSEARNYWAQLKLKYDVKENGQRSLWVERARSKLKLMEAK